MVSPSIATSRPLARGVFRPSRTIPGSTREKQGFSLLEMVIVVGLALVASAIALLMAKNVIRSVHLHGTAANYSNLLQQARVRAVQDDRYYSVIASTNLTVCGGNVAPCAFADLSPQATGRYASGDPILAFPSDVKPMASSSAPAVSNLEALFLPAGQTATVNTTAPGPTFGPRGTPCSPTPSGGYTTCPAMAATSYMTFMKNIRSQNWVAITVTPAGRIHLWSYTGSGTWSPMN